jgi:glycosyltransferase involved in cell wall biosynthesis
VKEFVQVAQQIQTRWPKARFVWAGEEDPAHPDTISAQWLRQQSAIEYHGRLSDVKQLFGEADVLLFPSYYREGIPRVVMEAAATGLPTVGFDVPGVREAVKDQQTGYLVPARDVEALTSRLAGLLEDKDKRLTMGRAARKLAEEAFDIRTIQGQYLDLYRELGIEI